MFDPSNFTMRFIFFYYSRGRAWCFAASVFKFPGFALIVVILPAFRCRMFLSLWDAVNRHQPFSLWLNFQLRLLRLYLSWLLKNQGLMSFPPTLTCNRPQWLRQRYFLLIVFGFFFRFFVRVFRSLGVYCTFGLFRLLVFFCPCAFVLSSFRVFLAQAELCILGYIYCFVHLCFALYLARSAQVSPSSPYIFLVPCAYISFAGVCSSPRS